MASGYGAVQTGLIPVANTAVKTTDGYTLRVFCIGFTKKNAHQTKKTCYAKASKVRKIRARMVEQIEKEVSGCDLKEKACYNLFPLQEVYIRKVKIIKKPKVDLGRLMDLHGDSVTVGADGEKVDRPDDYEPPIQAEV
ncbi:unnamed protein product [Caenorhabditis auriculariae]|uniref:40S ribosomal protein S3a n=1 Tax=Caenorhabditis auriculariae TaxID=2777116 RepID=A0A8S1HRA9_9PELO|nr:unnamed protein product [Caenorhabditis auriculariae]